jgi:outer membrane protein
VATAQAQVQAAQERVFQARAAYGPTVTLNANTSESRYEEAPGYALRQFSARQTAIQLTQPLLRTLLWPALDGAQAQLEQLQATLEQVRGESSVRLLEAAFEQMKARDTLSYARAQRLAAEEQLASARRAFKVGTVTVVDVRDAEAKVDTVDAQILAAQADLALRSQFLAELVGHEAPELLDRGLAAEALPTLPSGSVLEWLAEAQSRNPQLLAALQGLASAEAEVRKAWQGHAPTVDLTYNYSMSSDSGTLTSVLPRKGNQSQVGLAITVPLFASGATQSKVREAMALRDKAQADVDAARRAVQINVRQSFTTAISSVSLVRGLQTATRSLEVALKANQRGYEVGMKVGLDVLEAQSKLFESRRDLSKARYDAWLGYLRLKSFAGRLADGDLDELDAWLVDAPALAQPGPRSRGTGASAPRSTP